MKAVCWMGKEKMSVETVPDPTILNPRDAIANGNDGGKKFLHGVKALVEFENGACGFLLWLSLGDLAVP